VTNGRIGLARLRRQRQDERSAVGSCLTADDSAEQLFYAPQNRKGAGDRAQVRELWQGT